MFARSISKNAKSLVIFMALFMLSLPTSAQIDNCCFVDRHCTTNYEWVNGYWAYQNNQCAAPSQQQRLPAPLSQPQSETREENDNCCFIGWQCDTDEEWTSGYYAFQNNHCAAPTDSQPQAQPRGTASEEVNNCCFIGWQCTTDEEWTSGYWAFQHDRCDSPAQWQGQWSQLQGQQLQGQYRQRQSGNQQRQAPGGRPQPQPQWETRDWHACGVPCPPPNSDPPRTFSITIDLTDPNKRVQEADDGTPVVVDPELPD